MFHISLKKYVSLNGKFLNVYFYFKGAEEELKSAIGEISQLKNHVQTGKPFEKFSSTEPDTHLWNEHLEEFIKNGSKLNYYESIWLFAECYLYRKIREIFATKYVRFMSVLMQLSLSSLFILCNNNILIIFSMNYIFVKYHKWYFVIKEYQFTQILFALCYTVVYTYHSHYIHSFILLISN